MIDVSCALCSPASCCSCSVCFTQAHRQHTKGNSLKEVRAKLGVGNIVVTSWQNTCMVIYVVDNWWIAL